jgi:glutathione S-transferase
MLDHNFKPTVREFILAMILRSTSASPFARKVRIAAYVLGLADQIQVLPADTTDPNGTLRDQNLLGKIPTLMLAKR